MSFINEIDRVLRLEPELSDFGIGVYGGGEMPPAERSAKLLKDRASLRASSDRIEAAFEYLSEMCIKRNKSINETSSSYGLKHVVERDIGYITNGQFITAAIIAGYKYKKYNGSPNVCFNMSESPWKNIRKRQRG